MSTVITAEWLAGFIDGEGSLGIAGHDGNLQPRFRLNQRDDDAQMVRAIHAFLGVGTLHVKKANPSQKWWSANWKPQIALTVAGKANLRLIEVLDTAPLRSKKAREYPIWREAVIFYAANPLHRWLVTERQVRHARMAEFQAQLCEVRAYRKRR